MKVTDAMVARASRSMREDFALDTDDAARAALEAALTDVPEPSVAEAIYLDAVATNRRLDERVAELEAQFDSLRKAWERYQRDDLSREEFEGTVAGLPDVEIPY